MGGTSLPSPANQQSEGKSLSARDECRTIQVHFGDSCALADRCGISGADSTKYNSDPDLCSLSLRSSIDDNCASLAAANGITIEQIEEFSSNTWGWNGCSNLWAKTIICLSSGFPSMPAFLPNAVCGPQVPGTERPTDGTDLTDLNPCPLNACCNVFGQFRKIAYFEGYGFKRPCLYQDALQVDTSQYTHLQFGFGDITHDYQIHMGNALKTYLEDL
ncbi:hypothetical protein PHISP_05636 [Aspergillus sp. HF37]|nr:hypothetical protein PHISP_05636 [Aspergillus sp. HF37]